MQFIKKLMPLLLAALLVCGLFGGALADEENLLYNGSFELTDGDGFPKGWYTEQWYTQPGYTVYSVAEGGKDGTSAAVIDNLGANDARFVQSVEVEPESMYCLSGWVKVTNAKTEGWGANVSVAGFYSHSEVVYDTQGDWKYVELYGETGPGQRELTVYVRMGGYGGESEGHAEFDNIVLRKVPVLPAGVVADPWFSIQSSQGDTGADTSEAEQGVAAFWPWLLALTALYCALVYVLVRFKPRRAAGNGSRMPAYVTLGLVVAFLLRWFIAARVDGYQVDVGCFMAWGGTMANVGPTQFYQRVGFCDYPPAYVYVMGLCTWLSNTLNTLLGGEVPDALRATVIFKLLPMLCDVAMAWCVYHLAIRCKKDRHLASAAALAVAFNPVLIINSAAWCQIDSVMAVLLLIVAWMAMERRWLVLMPVFMLAVLVKPQALMMGFLGLCAIVMTWISRKEDHKGMLLGVGAAALVAAVIVVPFSVQQPLVRTAEDGSTSFGFWLIDKYAETLSSYSYATVNTANLYYLVNANWQSLESPAHWVVPAVLAIISLGWGWYMLRTLERGKRRLFWLEPAVMAACAVYFLICWATRSPWTLVGYGAMAQAFAIVLPLYVRAGKLDKLPLLGGVLFLLLYVLGIKMHERYLFPAIGLLAMAWVLRPDRRTLALLLGCTATMFINEGIVLDNSIRLGSAMGHLNNDTYVLNMILSVVNVAMVPLALWTAGALCLDAPEPAWFNGSLVLPTAEREPSSLRSFAPDPDLHWKRLDTVLLTVITLAYAVVTFANLGSMRAPQRPWVSSTADEQVVIDLGQHRDDFSMLYYAQVSYNDFSVQVSEDGENWSEPYWAQMAQGECFRWKYLVPSYGEGNGRSYVGVDDYSDVQKLSGRYVRINAEQIGLRLCEVIFRATVTETNADGGVIQTSGPALPAAIVSRTGGNEVSPNYSDPACLLDEQDSLEGEPGWYTGTYFDEIYHARTAYEHLHGDMPYETTHPPLGKVLMSWGVAIFGMTPFGWRFAGALAGVLMLPGMYLLAKQLTKRTSLGAAAALLLALDCMHFTQTRIATIDSFPVLFIIWAYLFMVRFMQRDLMLVPVKKLLPDLALSGLFMGCAIASKWIGIYAGAGLAVLYFWTCARHLRLAGEADQLLRERKVNGSKDRAVLALRAEKTFGRVVTLCLWCLLLFVLVPLVVYLMSYIPFIAPRHPAGFADYLKKVWDAQTAMLSYHGTPGLGMDHPFYSPWYEWPFNGKPMYYAMAYFVPAGRSMSIFCFSNPAIVLPSLAALVWVIVVWAKRHVYSLPGQQVRPQLLSTDWDVAPAFVIIGLLAQYLPWVLVPRGTYIYHFFASLPFLILASILVFNWVLDRWPKVGAAVMWTCVIAALVLFVVLYPYASGATVSTSWLDLGKKLLLVYYR